MKKKLQQIVAGTLIGFAALMLPVESEAKLKTVYDKVYHLQLKEEGRIIKKEKIRIVAKTNESKKEFLFSILTKDFNRTKWPKEDLEKPPHIRHTKIFIPEMGAILFHPRDVKIVKNNQMARLVYGRKHAGELLIPYKDHKNAQLAFAVGEEIIDQTLSKIPFAKKGYKKLMKTMEKKRERYLEGIFQPNKEYVATEIAFHSPEKLFGYVEIARTTTLKFEIPDDCKRTFSYWTNPAFGNSSSNKYSQGTWSEGFGQLESVVVNFTLGEKDCKNKPVQQIRPLPKKEAPLSFMEKMKKETKGFSFDKLKNIFNSEQGKIVFTKNQKLYSINADGTDLKSLIDRDELLVQNPLWSPDGTKLAFQGAVKEKGRYKTGIYLSNGNGKELKKITKGSGRVFNKKIRWFKDNQRLLVFEENRIYALNENGGIENVPYKKFEYTFNKETSPDKKLVLIEKRGEIYVMDKQTKKSRNITNTSNIKESDPSWSPNGKKVIFECFTRDSSGICTVNADGTDWKKLVKEKKGEYFKDPSWQPKQN